MNTTTNTCTEPQPYDRVYVGTNTWKFFRDCSSDDLKVAIGTRSASPHDPAVQCARDLEDGHCQVHRRCCSF
jgi:hypothetical protein